METKTIIFKDVPSLRREFKITNILSYPNDFKLEMAILTKEEVTNYNAKLEAFSSACGFKMAKIFMGAFTAFYTIAWYNEILPLAISNHAVNYILFALAGALVGKGLSLIINYYRINKVIGEIDQKVMARRPKKQRRYRESSYTMV